MIPANVFEAIIYDIADRIDDLVENLVLDDKGREIYKAKTFTSRDVEMFNTSLEIDIAQENLCFDADILPDNFWNE
ncbi:hypothetical protein [Pleurocapsa sp. FMAR1]|uniref:hypothetical protein n=1 Tax=Pleurocapsa sp. FMAR1 TaxID=3040204 RepID=UPI0029C97CE3|nr:hypothetical protein [Pleurocapsa sp. FMAR1]